MDESPPRTFTPGEEYESWDSHIQYWGQATYLSAEERARTKQAFQYLRQELGKSFLRRLFTIQHPFRLLFVNKAEWCRVWVVRFADALITLKEADNFKSLLKRIKSIMRKENDELSEAASVLETAFAFHKAGFKVSIDHKVFVTDARGRKRERKPDLKIADEETGEEIVTTHGF
jgi:hypothetical protein